MDSYIQVTLHTGDQIAAEWLDAKPSIFDARQLLDPVFVVRLGGGGFCIRTRDRALARALAAEIVRALDASEPPSTDPCDVELGAGEPSPLPSLRGESPVPIVRAAIAEVLARHAGPREEDQRMVVGGSEEQRS